MKKSLLIAIVLISCAILSGCAENSMGSVENETASQDVLYQVSTLDALMQGVYEGEITLDSLLDHGDFGIGTFNGLNGEMIILNDTVYQALSTGEVVKTDAAVTTPFAMITDFDADIQSDVSNIADYQQLQRKISALQPSQNIFYAIKVEGTFSSVQARSVPEQTEPYPLLAAVASEQEVFNYNDVTGTLVGYWCPAYMDGVNLPGYHLHFLSEDGSLGGHLLECSIKDAKISIDTTTEFQMLLPANEHFLQTDLSGVTDAEKQDVEQ